jgi:hypothetical protein
VGNLPLIPRDRAEQHQHHNIVIEHRHREHQDPTTSDGVVSWRTSAVIWVSVSLRVVGFRPSSRSSRLRSRSTSALQVAAMERCVSPSSWVRGACRGRGRGARRRRAGGDRC